MIRILVAGCLLLVSFFPSVAADKEEEKATRLAEALKNGTFKVDLRYRYEGVDDDGIALRGEASTLRTAIGYRSASFHGFRAAFQVEHVTDVGLSSKHANAGAGSLSNGVMGRPVIADPEVTEVQQAYLEYRGDEDFGLAVGRQEISVGDHRFIGSVPWRQNYQSFEAVRLDLKAIPRTKVLYAFLDRSNRINGGEWDQESHILDVAIKACKKGTVTPYYYVQDFDMQRSGLSASTATVGARWEATEEAGGWKIPYHLEYAQQSDAGDNPNDLDANYHRVSVAGHRGGLRLKIAYEMLGGDLTDGKFETPQATLHKFNGWADRFLRTPDNGLTDLAATVGWVWSERKVNAALTFHQFGADSAGPDHGSEFDGIVGWKSPWGQSFHAKFAVYRADTLDTLEDVTKFWVWSGYSF